MPLLLNGKMTLFLLDTGASSSLVDSSVRKEYGFTIGKALDSISGIGGSRRIYEVKDVELKYRDHLLVVPKLKTSNISEIREALKIVGILGSDYLNAVGANIDFCNKVLRF